MECPAEIFSCRLTTKDGDTFNIISTITIAITVTNAVAVRGRMKLLKISIDIE